MTEANADHARPLPLTGERTAPGVASENYWLRRHEVAYEFVEPMATDRTVLEIGCGEGYGTDRLARVARTVVGLDYDGPTIAHAAHTYGRARFVRANLAALPLADRSVDLVVALQVIEHVWNHAEFVDECRRVLRPAGQLVVSTPNRLTFSPGLDRPTNPFHTHEFVAAELTGLLTARGLVVELSCAVTAGARLRRLDERHGGFVRAQLAGAPEQWGRRLAADVRAVTTADFAVLRDDVTDVDDSLDIVTVARPGP